MIGLIRRLMRIIVTDSTVPATERDFPGGGSCEHSAACLVDGRLAATAAALRVQGVS